ncbi:very short patch repair endonuclease [Microvirga arabica]|uniref:very short patch repair endonuclease n=1 Tax=Microvirga arabica TaxID=1128671 RepID=UPI00193A2706|nr:very short patch repair endonuclease [Microvirga arabica]
MLHCQGHNPDEIENNVACRSEEHRAELLLRSALHRNGLRYRLHDRSLPGSSDNVFPRFEAVLILHGCYWHFHGRYRCMVPRSRRDCWLKNFESNHLRDQKKTVLLLKKGWRVPTVWECALRGKTARSPY